MARGRFRMSGGSLGGSSSSGGGLCPPGVFCLNAANVLMGIVVLLAVGVLGVFFMKHRGILDGLFAPAKPTVVVIDRSAPPTVPMIRLNADPRFAPLSPERSYGAPPDRGSVFGGGAAGLGAIAVNSQTRGYPDQFQQIGVVTAAGGTETSGTPTRTILPLFGRTIDSGRNRWNYYTRTDGMNPVQVPVQFKRRNCDDDNGCDEISDGDSVGVPVMGQSFTVSIYRYSTPRYMPM